MKNIIFFLFFASSITSADSCIEWFKKSKLKPGPKCLVKCTVLSTGMDTFDCPSQCSEFCKAKKCRSTEHWVDSYYKRPYVKGNGKPISGEQIKGHCKQNSSDYPTWNQKLKDGKPESWPHKSEQAAKWTVEERERVLEALEETPKLLKDTNLYGIFRVREAIDPNNPASNDYADIVIYDKAFSPDYNFTRILNHELAHRLYENLSEEEKIQFQDAGDWIIDSSGRAKAGRPLKQFVRKNDMLSPTEDFADDVTEYVHAPERLKSTAPKVYRWIQNRFGNTLKN